MLISMVDFSLVVAQNNRCYCRKFGVPLKIILCNFRIFPVQTLSSIVFFRGNTSSASCNFQYISWILISRHPLIHHDDVIKWKHFLHYWPFVGGGGGGGGFTGQRRIPLTKASDTELWCFLWSVPEHTVEQTIETPVIWDAIRLIMTSL